MQKTVLIFLLIICYTCIFGQTSNDEITYKSYEKYVYKIKISDQKEQTAFKIKGIDGLITTLHGFYSVKKAGINFQNYKITQIIDYLGNVIYNSKTSNSQIIVSKVDIDRDFAFFSFTTIPINEGFIIGSIDSVKLEVGNGIIYSSGNSRKLKAIPINISTEREKFREQISNPYEFNYYKKLKIPSLDCDLLILPNSCLFPGNSGSPIVSSASLELLAIAQASNHTDWAWGIIPNLENLKSYSQLSKNETDNLDNAYFTQLEKPILSVRSYSKSTAFQLKQIKRKRKTGFMVYHNLDTIGFYYRNYHKIRSKKCYPFLKAIPQSYLFFKQTGYTADISEINRSINVQKDELRIIYNDLFDLRLSLSKYIYSKQFIKVAALYGRYRTHPNEKQLIELNNQAQILYHLTDSIEPTKKEYRIWKRQKFDFIAERDSLLNSIAEETKNLTINKISDSTIKESFLINKGDTAEINKRNNLINDKDSLYNSCINKADTLFYQNNYENAHVKYLEAANYNKTAEYPKQKLKDIEKILKKHEILQLKINKLDTFVNNLLQEKIIDYRIAYKLPNIEYSINRTGINNENFAFSLKYGMSCNDFRLNSMYSNFPIGKYKYFGAEKAIEILDLTINAIYKMYSNIISEKGICITYIGHADGIPFSGFLNYDSTDFGELSNLIVRDSLNYESSFKSALNGNADQKNRALAFLRAYYAKYMLEESNDFLKENNKIFVVIHDEKGGQYRSVEVKIEFKIDMNKI